MNATSHWNAFTVRLWAVGLHNPHLILKDHTKELEAVNELLRSLVPDLAEDEAALAILPQPAQNADLLEAEDILPFLHRQGKPRHPEQAWTYPAGEWRHSE
jgi:hypothetical protein